MDKPRTEMNGQSSTGVPQTEGVATYPLAGVGRDDVHVHADEGDNAAGDGAGVLDDDVAPSLGVAHLPHDERAATRVRGHRAERVNDVLRHEVLLRDMVRRVVLQARRLADELPEEGDEGLVVQTADGVLERRRCHLRLVLGRRRRRPVFSCERNLVEISAARTRWESNRRFQERSNSSTNSMKA
jgi:hypothetical protein